jgi:hypothetical protein
MERANSETASGLQWRNPYLMDHAIVTRRLTFEWDTVNGYLLDKVLKFIHQKVSNTAPNSSRSAAVLALDSK